MLCLVSQGMIFNLEMVSCCYVLNKLDTSAIGFYGI